MNSVLPYEIPKDEPVRFLQLIKDNIVSGCLEGRFATTVFFWTRQLNIYMDLKYPLTVDERIWFANVYYELICVDNMDSALLDQWVNSCWKLLKKDHLFDSNSINWDWRPLYHLLRETLYPQQREKVYPRQSRLVENLIKVLPFIKRFFSPSATDEILAEFLPRLNPNSPTSTLTAFMWISSFLPTSLKDDPSEDDVAAVMLKGTFTRHPSLYWVDTLFETWSAILPSKSVDTNLLDIMASLSLEQYGRHSFYFSEHQLRYMLSSCHRWLSLPIGAGISFTKSGGISVGSKKTLSSGQIVSGMKVMTIDDTINVSPLMKRRKDRFKMLAEIIVYNLYPQELFRGQKLPHMESDIILPLLETWFQSLLAFCHPSNAGKWSGVIAGMLQYISQTLVTRVEFEKLGPKLPNSDVRFRDYHSMFKLDVESRQKLVKMMMPLLMSLIFGKDRTTVSMSQQAIRNLMVVDPDLIFPHLADNLRQSLVTLTETHRTTSAIGTLAAISFPMMHRWSFPEGAGALMSFLDYVLPGLDINDPSKTYASYEFFAKVLVHLPMVEFTETAKFPVELTRKGVSEEKLRDLNKAISQSSSLFEEWAHLYLDRTFDLFDRIQSSRDSTETNVMLFAVFSTDVLAHQLSIPGNRRLVDSIIERIQRFLTERIYHNAYHVIGDFINSFVTAFPKEMFTCLPGLQTKIYEEIDSGAGSDAFKGFKADDEHEGYGTDSWLIWYLKCVLAIAGPVGVLNDDSPLFATSARILLDISDYVWNKCNNRVAYQIAAKLRRTIIKSFGTIWLTEFRSIPPNLAGTDEINSLGVSLAERMQPDPSVPLDKLDYWRKLNAAWHIPSNDERERLLKIFKDGVLPEIDNLKKHIQARSFPAGIHGSGIICKSVTMLCRMIQAMTSLVAPLVEDKELNKMDVEGVDDPDTADNGDEDGEDGEEDGDTITTLRFPVTAYYCFKVGDEGHSVLSDLRIAIGRVAESLLAYLAVEREDDIESIYMVLKLVRIYINDRGIDKSDYSRHQSGLQWTKALFRSHRGSAFSYRYPRDMMLRRLYFQEITRVLQNGLLPISGVEREIGESLLKHCKTFALSRYAHVRSFAQDVVIKSLRFFKPLKYSMAETIFDDLKKAVKSLLTVGKNENDARESLFSRMKGALYLINSRTFMNICLRTPKYQRLFFDALCETVNIDKQSVQDLASGVIMNFAGKYTEPPLSVYPSISLLRHVSMGKLSEIASDVRERLDSKKADTIKAILEMRQEVSARVLSAPNPHWHQTIVACNFLQLLQRDDCPLTAESASFFLKCINDDVLSVRRFGSSALARVMFLLKKRSVAANSSVRYCEQLSAEKVPNELMEAWNPSLKLNQVVDKASFGWQFSPKSVKVYNLDGVDRGYFASDSKSREAAEVFHKIFATPEFWNKYLNFSQMEVSAQRAEVVSDDVLSIGPIRFYKSVFQLFHDEFLYTNIAPIVSKWFVATSEKPLQRASIEFIVGLIRGMKHWRPSESEKCWKWLLPAMKRMFLESTFETIGLWNQAFYWITNNRHPARLQPLIDMILVDHDGTFKVNFETDTAFTESKKVNFSRLLIRNYGSRLRLLVPDLLQKMSAPDYLSVRYKLVRDMIGGLVSELICSASAPAFPIPVGDFISTVKKSPLHILKVTQCWYNIDECGLKFFRAFVERLRVLQVVDGAKVYGTEYSHVAKTMSKYITDILGSGRSYLALPYIYDNQMGKPVLGDLIAMQALSDDNDLSEAALRQINLMPDISLTFSQALDITKSGLVALKKLLAGADDSDRSKRTSLHCLAFLQVFSFRNFFFVINSDAIDASMTLVCDLLLHADVEIRQLASITLCGLVRSCSLEKVESLITLFKKWLVAPIRRASSDATVKQVELIPGALVKRHGAILGLSAIIMAYPYTVPKWLPDTLLELSKYQSDPAPVSKSVHYVFSEFRRTHQDTWSQVVGKTDYVDFYQYSVVDKEKPRRSDLSEGVFTPAHLETLEGLLANSAQYFF